MNIKMIEMCPSRTATNTAFLIVLLFNTVFLPIDASFSNPTNRHKQVLKYQLRSPYVAAITHNVYINNSGPSAIRDVELLVPLIQNETARHLAIVHNFSPDQPDFQEDAYGNRYAYWHRDKIDSGRSFSASIEYYVLAFSVSFRINSSLIEGYDNTSTIYQRYTQPEELIQFNHSQIISNATKIMGNETNSHEIALKIYRFVLDTVSYVQQDRERGALWALVNKTGDCSEFSYLFVALCRAVGIPSRVQTGFAFHQDTQTLSEGHMWAEYHLENYGWVPVDPTWRLFDELDSHHFSSLRSKPELTSYVNYVFNYSKVGYGVEPHDEQTIAVNKAPIHLLDDFPSAQRISDAVSKIEKVEWVLRMAKLLGAHVLLSFDFKNVEGKILDADLYVQEAVENGGSSIAVAQQHADEALDSAESMILKMVVVIALVFLIAVITVIAVVMLSSGREKVSPYEYGY